MTYTPSPQQDHPTWLEDETATLTTSRTVNPQSTRSGLDDPPAPTRTSFGDAPPAPTRRGFDEPRPPWRPEPLLSHLNDPKTAAAVSGTIGVIVGLVLAVLVVVTFIDFGSDRVELSATDPALTRSPNPLAADGVAPGGEDPTAAETEPAPAEVTTSTSTTSTTAPTTASTEAPTTAPTPSTTTPTIAPSEQPTTAPPPTEPPTTTTSTPATEAPPTAPPSSEAPTTAPPVTVTPGNDAAIQQEILALTNAERAAVGCPALSLQPNLNAAADGHAEDMARNDYFSHTDLNGGGPGDRAQAAGYQYRGVGENIAVGQTSAAQVMNGWMNSQGHRENILNCNWTHLGVGYAEGGATNGNYRPIYWAQVFGVQ